MFTRTIAAILVLGCFVAQARAGDLPKFKPIDPATIAAYEKLGAEYGTLNVSPTGTIYFSNGKDSPMNGLPGFRFYGNLPALPPVHVPFGLYFFLNEQLTDARVKELKDLKHLTVLSFSHTKVTDAALRELKGLENLVVLDLR